MIALKKLQPYTPYILISTLTFLVCLAISWQGSARELLSNSVYIQLIETYPTTLGVRIEPLFVTILWLTSFLTGPVASIILWRIILTWLQLFFIFRFFTTIKTPRSLVVTVLLLYSSSVVTYSLADNLLRNNAALTLSLGVLSWVTWLIYNNNRSWWQWTGVGILIGGIFYTHIFMASIVASVLIGYLVISVIAYAIRIRNLHFETSKFLVIAVVVAGIVFTPYFSRLYSNKAGISDYRQTSTTTQNTLPGGSGTTDEETITPEEPSEPAAPLTTKQKILRLARIIFEYRDTSLPIGLMAFLSVLLIALVLKSRQLLRIETLLILLFWLVTYLGTKLDFFGIGVVSYRFSLILSTASLFLIILGLRYLLSSMRNRNARLLLIIAVIVSFIGHNFPIVAENYILKQNDLPLLQYEAEKAVVTDSLPSGARVIQLGTSLESIRQDLTPIDYRAPFETENPRLAADQLRSRRIDYLVFTDTVQSAKKSLDAQAVTNHWEPILTSPYFRLLDMQLFGPHAVYSMERNLEKDVPTFTISTFKIDDPELEQKLTAQIGNQSIQSWAIRIQENTLLEEIRIPRQIIRLDYPSQSLTTTGKVFPVTSSQLRPLELRHTVPSGKLWYVAEKTGVLSVWLHTESNTSYTSLSDYSRDTLTLTSQIKYTNDLRLTFLPRSTFRFLFHLLIALIGIGIYYLRRDPKDEPIPTGTKVAVGLLFFDLLIFSQLFFALYLKFI